MDSKRIIGGLLAATALGAVIGILLAPSSGERTRSKLIKGTRKLANNLEDSVGDSLGVLKSKFNSGVGEVLKKGNEMLNYTNDKLKV